jgi:hypothetical protein
MDFMGKTGARIDLDKGNLSLAVVSKVLKNVSVSPSRQAALTVFPRDKKGYSPHPSQLVAREKDKNDGHSSNRESTIS